MELVNKNYWRALVNVALNLRVPLAMELVRCRVIYLAKIPFIMKDEPFVHCGVVDFSFPVAIVYGNISFSYVRVHLVFCSCFWWGYYVQLACFRCKDHCYVCVCVCSYADWKTDIFAHVAIFQFYKMCVY